MNFKQSAFTVALIALTAASVEARRNHRSRFNVGFSMGTPVLTYAQPVVYQRPYVLQPCACACQCNPVVVHHAPRVVRPYCGVSFGSCGMGMGFGLSI